MSPSPHAFLPTDSAFSLLPLLLPPPPPTLLLLPRRSSSPTTGGVGSAALALPGPSCRDCKDPQRTRSPPVRRGALATSSPLPRSSTHPPYGLASTPPPAGLREHGIFCGIRGGPPHRFHRGEGRAVRAAWRTSGVPPPPTTTSPPSSSCLRPPSRAVSSSHSHSQATPAA